MPPLAHARIRRLRYTNAGRSCPVTHGTHPGVGLTRIGPEVRGTTSWPTHVPACATSLSAHSPTSTPSTASRASTCSWMSGANPGSGEAQGSVPPRPCRRRCSCRWPSAGGARAPASGRPGWAPCWLPFHHRRRRRLREGDPGAPGGMAVGSAVLFARSRPTLGEGGGMSTRSAEMRGRHPPFGISSSGQCPRLRSVRLSPP